MYEDLGTYLVSLETSLLDARMRNPAKVAELLDDTYVEFRQYRHDLQPGRSGRRTANGAAA